MSRRLRLANPETGGSVYNRAGYTNRTGVVLWIGRGAGLLLYIGLTSSQAGVVRPFPRRPFLLCLPTHSYVTSALR